MKNFATRISAVAVASALGCLVAPSAHAIGFTQGDWSFDVSGTINAFYTTGETKASTAGGASTTTKQVDVQNGLLPGWINFVATTKQKGFDIKAHFGFAPGINSNSSIVGLPSGTAVSPYPQIDSRNVYFQFGNASMGTFKFGRDIGLFGQTPILNDMTLLGVGGTPFVAELFNTTFGMIGHGYMYTGFQPQITYSTPNMGGLQASVGLFHPSNFGVATAQRKSPGVQGLVAYDWKGGMNGKVWAAFVDQKTSGTGGFKANGFEGGVKLGFGRFEALASAFTGKGLGISTVGAQFLGGTNAAGQRLKSDGHFLQGTFQATDDLKIGLGYGKNKDKDLVAVGSVADRKAATLGSYYKLTPSVTLVGEYVSEKGKNLAAVNDSTKVKALSLGAILFF